jgi:preprotein translocase subunit SecB
MELKFMAPQSKNLKSTKIADGQQVSLPVTMRAQYIKHLAFENPNPLETFNLQIEEEPNIDVNIQARANDIGHKAYEVVLDINANATYKGKVMFKTHLEYAGVLVITGDISEEATEALVMIESPHLLFPFARVILAEATRNGGFPPLYLSPIDFAALYVEHQGKTKKDAAEEAQPSQAQP